MVAKMILHIVQRKVWEQAKHEGLYCGDTLATEGFIHCSLPEQIVKVANYNYKGEVGLVLLCIDPAQVTAEVRFEDLYDAGEDYPHIYGPVNIDAVIQVLDFDPEEDGTFRLPEKLA